MKKSKFTEEQIAFALHQAQTGTSVEEVCRKLGISQATFYAWKKTFGAVGVSECIDPALSAQVRLLKHKPRQGSSCSGLSDAAPALFASQFKGSTNGRNL